MMTSDCVLDVAQTKHEPGLWRFNAERPKSERESSRGKIMAEAGADRASNCHGRCQGPSAARSVPKGRTCFQGALGGSSGCGCACYGRFAKALALRTPFNSVRTHSLGRLRGYLF